jgi:hypothetical protein
MDLDLPVLSLSCGQHSVAFDRNHELGDERVRFDCIPMSFTAGTAEIGLPNPFFQLVLKEYQNPISNHYSWHTRLI